MIVTDNIPELVAARLKGEQYMTWAFWQELSRAERDRFLDPSQLTPGLIGHEGCRVEVETLDGIKRRFIVGRSTGWKPIHLEIKRRNSRGGEPAERSYRSVLCVERVR